MENQVKSQSVTSGGGGGDDKVELAYKPGDIIQDFTEPFVKVLSPMWKGSRCDSCFQAKEKLFRCSNCRQMHYCSRKCQVKDWKHAHSLECKIEVFSKDSNLPSGRFSMDTKWQIFRLYAHLELHPENASKAHPMYDGTSRCFNDLISHMDLRPDEDLGQMASFLKLYNSTLTEGSSKEIDGKDVMDYLRRLMGILQANAFEMSNEKCTMSIGSGLFIGPSGFDHSCRPTAIWNQLGCRLQVRAISAIPKGQKPVVTYLAGHRTRVERQWTLKLRYNFDCRCALCEEEVKHDVIDYGKLMKLKTFEGYVGWKHYLDVAQQIKAMMRKCYTEYDERITNQAFLALGEAGGLEAPKKILAEMAKDVEQRLLITFGAENSDLEKLRIFKATFGI